MTGPGSTAVAAAAAIAAAGDVWKDGPGKSGAHETGSGEQAQNLGEGNLMSSILMDYAGAAAEESGEGSLGSEEGRSSLDETGHVSDAVSDAVMTARDSQEEIKQRVSGGRGEVPLSQDVSLAFKLKMCICDTSGLIGRRRWRFRTYQNVCVGHEVVDWMVETYGLSTRDEAVAMGQSLINARLMHHVANDHPFQDDHLFYRFFSDEPASKKRKPSVLLQRWTGSEFARGIQPRASFSTERTASLTRRGGLSMADFHGTTFLSRGGFSAISIATHTNTNRKCVLKMLERPTTESLKREVWCLNNLRSRHVVRSGAEVFRLSKHTRSNFVSASASHVLCFEYANGGDLFDFIDRWICLEETLARRLFRQLLDALAYLHTNGCVHLDIKTENILLHVPSSSASGEVELKLADFGLSKVAALGDNVAAVRLETGTERSMAPEVHTHARFDGRRADMWSAGTVFFNMLTGYPPCEIALPSDRSYAHLQNNDYASFWKRYASVANVSCEARDLVNRLLRRDPTERLCAHDAAQHPLFHVKPLAPTVCATSVPTTSMMLATPPDVFQLGANAEDSAAWRADMMERLSLDDNVWSQMRARRS